MRYHGGKTNVAKEISEVLTNAIYGRQVTGIDRACEPAEYIFITKHALNIQVEGMFIS